MLTQKQLRLMRFIQGFMAKNNYAPSFEEMRVGIGGESKSSVHRKIHALVERGFIRQLPHRARAIEVIRSVK